MDQNQTAPPTVPGPIAPTSSSWPVVVGVISIIIGAGGVLGNLWALVAPLLMGRAGFFGFQGDPEGQGIAQAMRDTFPMQAAAAGLNLVAACLLLAAGIGVVSRKRWGVKASRVYAVLRLVTGLIATVIGLMVQRRMMEATSSAGAAMPPGMYGLVAGAGMVLGLAWAWAYPVFLLIWFSRRTIREEVAQWS